MLVAFDKDAILREFHYPLIGQENQTNGEPFRFGVWINGSFSWIPEEWNVERSYLDDTLVTQVEFSREDLKITLNDWVDFHENIYFKKFTVKNLTDEEKEVRLFLHQDFHIYGNSIGDTAAYKPECRGVLHYKEERYFLINIFANHKFGIDFYATGNKETETSQGTWKDAEDGVLSGNPIAQGSVDSVIGIPLTLAPKSEETCYYWIAAGKNWEEVKLLNDLIKKKTPEEFFIRTVNYWKLWVNKEHLNYDLLPEKIAWLYKKSLLICRTQINNSGSIIAANDSDAIYFNRDTYSYMWPRDGANIAYGLDLAGYAITQNFYRFCGKIIEKEGYFLHKYTPTGSLASSWHAWIQDNKPQLPIQEDETALVIWALWNHHQIFRDIEFIAPLYKSLIKKSADFMMNYRDRKTGLPLPSFDLWEERQGIFTYTVSAVYGGIMAAAHFAEEFGEKELAEEYRQGAAHMRRGMDEHLYLPDKKRFARYIRWHRDGTKEVDDTIDASVYAIFAFGAYDVEDEKVKSTMDQVLAHLWLEEAGGGLIRYEEDPFYREEGQAFSNPWFICTLWVAQYEIARAKSSEDLHRALEIFEWVADHALPSGVLAEQVNPITHEPISVSPLTWSHGAYIATVQQYLNKLLALEKCEQCQQNKLSKQKND